MSAKNLPADIEPRLRPHRELSDTILAISEVIGRHSRVFDKAHLEHRQFGEVIKVVDFGREGDVALRRLSGLNRVVRDKPASIAAGQIIVPVLIGRYSHLEMFTNGEKAETAALMDFYETFSGSTSGWADENLFRFDAEELRARLPAVNLSPSSPHRLTSTLANEPVCAIDAPSHTGPAGLQFKLDHGVFANIVLGRWPGRPPQPNSVEIIADYNP